MKSQILVYAIVYCMFTTICILEFHIKYTQRSNEPIIYVKQCKFTITLIKTQNKTTTKKTEIMVRAKTTKYQCKNTLTDDILNIQKCEIDVDKKRCIIKIITILLTNHWKFDIKIFFDKIFTYQ